MVNYANGKIYMIHPIYEHKEGEIYIGSTTKQYLSQRMNEHRTLYARYQIGDTSSWRYTVYNIFDKYGIMNCEIYLIESFPCNSKDELHSREGFYIRNKKWVNALKTGATREELLQFKKNNRVKNKEKIEAYNETRRVKFDCECGGRYSIAVTYMHIKSSPHLEYLKAGKVKAPEENIACECGGHYKSDFKVFHNRTIKHQEYLKYINSETRPIYSFICECTGWYNLNTKSYHFKTSMHKEYSKKIETTNEQTEQPEPW